MTNAPRSQRRGASPLWHDIPKILNVPRESLCPLPHMHDSPDKRERHCADGQNVIRLCCLKHPVDELTWS